VLRVSVGRGGRKGDLRMSVVYVRLLVRTIHHIFIVIIIVIVIVFLVVVYSVNIPHTFFGSTFATGFSVFIGFGSGFILATSSSFSSTTIVLVLVVVDTGAHVQLILLDQIQTF
jgi:hypothetical protein